MAIKQHYYTSCQTSRMSGFQVKAKSPGLTEETERKLQGLIGYKIPSECDINALETHPIALRYYADDQDIIITSSQSNGQDELDRPGNYFAHSIIATPEDLAYLNAPIFYWKSPFWIKQDDSSHEELAILPEFSPEVTFDFDQIWNFIQKNNNIEWLYKLLCAVLDYPISQRKIVILDEVESIALWIAAITSAVLPRYTYFLSFATYHHDPYRVPFIITGTTRDSNFRCNSDEYTSYFVLNSFEQRISNAPDSVYAKYLIERFNPEQYDTDVLEFFSWLERFDTQSKLPQRRLDDLTNFYKATIQHSLAPQSDEAVTAAKIVIADLAKKSPYELEDIQDLQKAWKILAEKMVNLTSSNLIEDVIQGLKILKRADTAFLQTCTDALDILTQLVLRKSLDDAERLESELYDLYSREFVIRQLSNPQLIQPLSSRLKENDIEQVILFWKSLGKSIKLDENNETSLKNLIQKTFICLHHQGKINDLKLPYAVSNLISALLLAGEIPSDFLIKQSASYQQNQRNSPVLQWIYYAIVENTSLEGRAKSYWQYHRQLKDVDPSLIFYELQRDLLKVNQLEQKVEVIHQWVNLSKESISSNLIRASVSFLWKLPDVESYSLAIQLLNHSTLNQLIDTEVYQKLVEVILTKAKIIKPDQELFNLYQSILDNPKIQLLSDHQTILKGVVALFKGKLQEADVSNLERHFAKIDAETYQREVKELMAEFFSNKLDADIHFKLVRSVYNPKNSQEFWNLYWDNFKEILVEKSRIDEIINILDLWFNYSASLMENYHYVVPEFFTELPSLLEEIRGLKSYRKIEKDFEGKLQRKKWYPIIQKYLKKNKGLLGNLF